jgi:hypothetical protein
MAHGHQQQHQNQYQQQDKYDNNEYDARHYERNANSRFAGAGGIRVLPASNNFASNQYQGQQGRDQRALRAAGNLALDLGTDLAKDAAKDEIRGMFDQ